MLFICRFLDLEELGGHELIEVVEVYEEKHELNEADENGLYTADIAQEVKDIVIFTQDEMPV